VNKTLAGSGTTWGGKPVSVEACVVMDVRGCCVSVGACVTMDVSGGCVLAYECGSRCEPALAGSGGWMGSA
jgi:hypothetical protein